MTYAITGGIGSGKSYICNMLKAMGYPVYNSDDEAKRLMVESMEIINAIRNLVGHEAYIEQHTADGKSSYTLNKGVIANFLFANPTNAAKINAIVHPVVKKDFHRWAQEQSNDTIFMECAILFESGFDNTVDKSILVYADEDIRLHRAMNRDNASEAKIRERMQQQISGEEACKKADYIFNHNQFETTDEELGKMLRWIGKYKS